MSGKLQGAAAEFLRTRFGGELTEDELTVTVGTSAIALVGGNPDRLLLLFVNLSTNIVYIGLDETVTATSGIRLDSNGGSASIAVQDDGMLPTRQWFAIADGAGSEVYAVRMSRFISEQQIISEEATR